MPKRLLRYHPARLHSFASAPPQAAGRLASPWAELRIGVCSAFRARTVALPELSASRVRFSLGGSAADARVPWDVTAEAARIVGFSGVQLLALLVARHREALTRADHDRLMMDERFAALPEATDHVGWVQVGNPDARAAAAAGPRAHPLLTAGVMAAWLGPGGAGRSLVALLIELLRTAHSEMPRDGREETPTLVAAMLATLLGEAAELSRRVPLSPPTDRLLQGAVASGLYLAARTAVERVLRESRLPPDVSTRVEAAVNPAALLGGRLELPGSGSTIYGCDLSAGLPWFEEALSRMADGATADVVQLRIAEAMAADKDVRRRAEAAVAQALLREKFLAAATLVDQGFLPAPLPTVPRDFSRLLREYATLPYRLSALAEDEAERKRLSKEAHDRASSGGRALSEGLLPLSDALRRWTSKEPLTAFGLSREDAFLTYARATVAVVSDLWTERALAPTFRVLERRTGLESEGGNDGEYARGRLYRLSADRQALLKEEVAQHVGHLFADVKDFTRRTALVGQAAMGELLRREFYVPVIASAKAHHTSHGPLASGNLQLNNLLGDAVSLSGSITALLGLARDLRRHLSAYERQLAREVSKESVEKTVAELEERFLQRLSQDPSRAEALRLQADHETALARARGEGLEAGVFLSWGPAPLVLTIPDDVFGTSRVAIADKINESARGTARNPGARVRADALLDAERARRGDGSVKHPWAVFVGSPLPPGANASAEDHDEPPGDIYNTGIALSEEALLGFQQEVGRDRVFRGVDVWPQTLHPELQRRFHFPPTMIRLIVAYAPDTGAVKEVFRYAGRVMFKGFEAQGGIRVWELVSETSAGGLIALHHAREWFGAATGR